MRDAIHLPDAVPAIGRAAQVQVIEMCERDDGFGRVRLILDRRQNDRLWPKPWRPEQGLAIRRCVGIGWEIATPNAGRRLPTGRSPVASS